MTKRDFLALAMGAPFMSGKAFGQALALPLKNLGLEHLDILVPDTAASAQVYMRIFRTKLHQQPFQGGVRYFILLGDLPQNREVGYFAIGAQGTRPTSIGHYCARAECYDRAGVAAALQAAGFSAGSGGAFGMLPDPDGLELQLFQPPAGLVADAVPSTLAAEANGLVKPVGVDHVLLHVTDIEKSLPYYHLVYGANIKSTRLPNPDRLWLQLEANTRIGLQKVPAGQKPRIDHYCTKVEPFDRAVVTAGLQQVGLKVDDFPWRGTEYGRHRHSLVSFHPPGVIYIIIFVIYEFRWNEHNVEHIAKHGVESGEAEYVVEHPAPGFPRAETDGKYLVWGQTEDGRYLQVVYVFSRMSVVYVIHARDLGEQEKRRLRRRRK